MKKYESNKSFINDFDVNERYEALAAAILQQAVVDYKKIASKKTKNKNDEKAKASELKTIERFFLSGYGQSLSYHHGEYIVERCRKEAAQEK